MLQRLFPNAYPPHDPEAAHDFRRFTEHDQRTRKLADADVVRDHLAATEGGRYPVQIDETATQAWLRTLTAVRLAVATRLGVTDADSLDELASCATTIRGPTCCRSTNGSAIAGVPARGSVTECESGRTRFG